MTPIAGMGIRFMKEFFQINNLSYLHNAQDIFFCKTDYIKNDFLTISKINHDVIFITGNSDYSITDDLTKIAPKNIKKWYCQNAISNSNIIAPIPIGMENGIDCFRCGHGVAYKDRAEQKKQIISNLNIDKNPKGFIYANFNIETNRSHRLEVKNAINNIDYIDWQNPTLGLFDFFNTLIKYKIVLCPAGNGVDTHRLWEVLYCNRIPLIIKLGDFNIYNMYKDLPIIIIDQIYDLYNKDIIMKKYNESLSKSLQMCEPDYWISRLYHDV